jgi:hypothetical protein
VQDRRPHDDLHVQRVDDLEDGQDDDGNAEQHGDPQQRWRGPHGPDGQEDNDQGE